MKIKGVLQAKTTSAEQDILHKNDEDTTWFGIIREDSELPLFRDYGRYADIMTDSSTKSSLSGSELNPGVHDHRFPSLVSFIGQTGQCQIILGFETPRLYPQGAGKSTIIKLVIDLITTITNNYPSPVVGSVGADVPTSGDVHLYSDPLSSRSNNPILYADCEGLEGGEREPLGARLRRKDKTSRVGRVGSLERKRKRIHHTSEREITWANTNAKQSREFAVTHLYPRLLYTFSDVVVFVLKNPR